MMDLPSFLDFLSFIEKKHSRAQAKQILLERCAYDLELFAQIYFPHYCRYRFNEFHSQFFQDHKYPQRNLRRVYIAPRGSAKSTTATLISPIHDLVFKREKFILIISHTQDQAIQKLKDIRSELVENDCLHNDFGNFFQSKMVNASEFTANCGNFSCKFKAVGTGTEIRGIRHKEARPTKIIFDDIEHSERVENEILRKKDAEYFFEVVSKVGSETTNIEGVGTILHEDSLLQKLSKNPIYETKLYKSIISWSDREDLWEQWRSIMMDLENPDRKTQAQAFYEQNKQEMLLNTKVLWPEKEDYLYLQNEILEIGKPAFLQEKQNEPINPEDRVFHQLHYYKKVPEGFYLELNQETVPFTELKNYCFGALDPATGQTKPAQGAGSDFSCIVVGYLHPKTGRIFVDAEWTKVAPPSVFIQQVFNMNETFHFSKFAVEINLFRNLLMQDLVRERKEREKKAQGKLIQMPFYEIENNSPKRQRIFALEPKVSHGWIVFNRNLSQEFINQISQFPNAAHDDAPDALEMLYNLCHNKYPASPVSLDALGRR
jgi:predicted phage terminase large subunit-like protein